MSKRRETIDLEPESLSQHEGFCSRPMTCPCCGGRGYHHTLQKDPETLECETCEGTGEVVAMVTIEWKPNKR